MRRLLPVVVAAAALLAPATARGQPQPPGPTAAALRGTPYLVRADAHRVTLYVRLNRALAQRFDGEPLASAAIDGHIASLAPVAGRRGRGAACYSARMWLDRAEPGRVVSVSVLVDGAPPVALSALVAIRAPKRGDERGAPLRC
jgi:hypothetical protein